MKILPLQIRPAFHRAAIMQSTILLTLKKDSQYDEGQSVVKMVSKILRCRPRGVYKCVGSACKRNAPLQSIEAFRSCFAVLPVENEHFERFGIGINEDCLC